MLTYVNTMQERQLNTALNVTPVLLTLPMNCDLVSPEVSGSFVRIALAICFVNPFFSSPDISIASRRRVLLLFL